MPTYKFEVELTLHCVYSPGTWLANRDNLYIIVDVFNSCRRTRLVEPIFPLLIHEKFVFHKIFYSALSACNVIDRLDDERIRIELRQITDVYCGGTLLAYFETTARELFCPCAHMCTRTLPKNEITLLRTIDFPGISPRLEYSASSEIKYHPYPPYELPYGTCRHDCLTHYSRPLTPNYHRPTVTSALRCRYPDNPERLYTPLESTYREVRSKSPSVRSCTSSRRTKARPSSERPRDDLYTTRIPVLSHKCTIAPSWDLRDKVIRDAQDRSDRYWNLYRFWQLEADRRRARHI
ncbi:spermatogenesis-associated protein 6 [Clonorchis sinensis]|uniref:Spermatogenesis-associated protein 6 n=1 Tax=Clonorchis sinensis TaxID=79923 RepID=A0A8T1M2I5_CLOSI|nr:spermatogenesis-associated protein 6 [Clonorchis sinensis]